jgi:hypothetical protein
VGTRGERVEEFLTIARDREAERPAEFDALGVGETDTRERAIFDSLTASHPTIDRVLHPVCVPSKHKVGQQRASS